MSLSVALLQDHIAELLLFHSNTLLFWFTVNTSSNHDLHLSRWFGLSPHDYECVHATTNLVHYTKSDFTIKPKDLKIFFDGHYSAVVEGIEECKVELNKKKVTIEKLIDQIQLDAKRLDLIYFK